jgi:hypothetical protein
MGIQDLRDQMLELDAPALRLQEQFRHERLKYESIDRDLDRDIGKTEPTIASIGRIQPVQDQEVIEDATDAVLGSPRTSPRRTRRDTRLASYVYPTPVYGTDDEDGTGSGPPPDPKHVPRLDDDDDVSRPNLRSTTSSSKRSTTTPRSSKTRAPKDLTNADM